MSHSVDELLAEVERLLREHQARPDRCCDTGCLHCPTARRKAWSRLAGEVDPN